MSEAGGRKLLRREEVEKRFGLSRSWIYSEMRAGRFPEPVRIGQRAVRWRVSDLDEWAEGRPVADGEVGRRRTRRRRQDADSSVPGPGDGGALRERGQAKEPKPSTGRPVAKR